VKLALPIVQAPMAGGPSTPALAAAVSEAGGLGFLGAGYKTVETVRDDLLAVRALTDRPVGLNLFAPPAPVPDRAAVQAYAEALGPGAGTPRHDDDGLADKLAMATEYRVPVVSFAFGCPAAEVLARLPAETWVTVTTVQEARLAQAAGADALVVQGVEAGGHRGSFDDTAPGDIGLLALLQLVRAAVGLPLIATRGSAPMRRPR
jgi:nitronate monooxygenase